MNNIEIYTHNLPTTIEDISKFVLFGREKLAIVRAQIRAIDKLQIAEEVRNQKKAEAQLLAEALLDAEVRLGELFQKLPKATNQYKSAGCSAAPSKINDKNNIYNSPHQWGELINEDSNKDKEKVEKPKKEIIQDLGFDRWQAKRFETLAKNKDLIEQVKQEARENDDIPTRTQVLSLAKARKHIQEQKEKSFEEWDKKANEGKKLYGKLIDSLGIINRLSNEDIHNCMLNLDDTLANDILERLTITKLQIALLEQEAKKYKGVKLWQDK